MPTFWDQMPAEMDALMELGRPAVFLTPVEEENDLVISDIHGGAEAMMDHLLALGHTRIGFINGVARVELTRQRQRVYRDKLAEAALPYDEALFVQCGPTMQDGYEATRGLCSLDRPPTAIWTINDLLAIGARRALDALGLRVPEDVALAGCDNTAIAAQLAPPLTTIHIPAQEIGKRAARLLLHRIDDPGAEPVRDVFPTHLVVRRSTDPSLPA
jgi:DNA-binding LacI/PurR family transcriptional regulator